MDYIMTAAEKLAEESSGWGWSHAKDLIARVRDFVFKIAEPFDQSRFLQRMLEYNDQRFFEHQPIHQYTSSGLYCGCRDYHDEVEFELTQDLKRLGYVPDGSDTFTSNEAKAADQRVDEILARLKTMESEMSAAHEVFYEELLALKDMHYLGKKTWKSVLLGKLTEMAIGGVIGEAVSKPLLEAAIKAI